MINYNPFNKPLSKLKENDLNILINKEIAEGWFIEYKIDFIKNDKIAKCIASFANTDGGWFFIGINDDENNAAKEIIGFDISKNKNPKERVRDIIKNISPVPYFESKLIKLKNGNYVLAVLVYRGDEPPYITKDGIIYIRNNEGNDPIKTTDRYIIEKLFERKKESRLKIEYFCENTSINVQFFKEISYLEVFILPHPFDVFSFNNFLKEEFFYEIKNNFNENIPIAGVENLATLKFNEIYSSFDSYILKSNNITMINENLEYTNNLRGRIILEIFKNGNTKIRLPLPTIFLTNINTIEPNFYKDSSNIKEFYNILNNCNYRNLKIIDAYTFFFCFIIIINQYLRLIKNYKYKNDLFFRLRFNNIFNHVLFFDDENYISFVKNNGVPICEKNKVEIPDFYDGKSIGINISKNKNDIAISFVTYIFESIGIPFYYVSKNFNNISEFIKKTNSYLS